MGDSELLALYRIRDPEATAAMQRQYGAYCAGIVHRLLPDPRDSEECLNDIWLRVWNALETQRPLNLKGWLGAVARNCAISRYQQRQQHSESLEDCTAELTASLQDTPAEQLESRILGEAISDFLKTQPESIRVAFVRRYWYGDTTEQVARHVGWSVSKTKTTLHRTRNKLKAYLTKEGLYHG